MAAPWMTIADIVREHRRSRPNAIALVDGATRISWSELDRRSSALANRLAAVGLGQGDRILWMAQTSCRLFVLLAAAARIGAMVCPINWRQSAAEMQFVIEDFSPKVIVWQAEEIGAAVHEARALARTQALWLQLDGEPGELDAFAAAGEDADTDREIDPGSPLLVIYTAAFGGRPNGSMLTHRNLIAMGTYNALLCGVTAQSVFLNSGPMFHIGNFAFEAIPVLLSGGKNVFVRRVVAQELLEIVHAERCTGAFLMPPTIMQMVEANAGRRYDLSCLKAGPNAPLWKGMTTVDSSAWTQLPGGFGQTEVSGFCVFRGNSPGGIGNAGRPSPFCSVRIVDDAGLELPVGEVGELVVRGDIVHAGYWNRPELNAQRLRNGWWHTGDVGMRHEDGTLTFIGTKARMIKSAAENIYPAEVESCIEAHPAVKEAAVIGVPDPRWRQSVRGIVVLRPGHSATAEEIIEHCRHRIASYKKPKSVEFVDVLPRLHGLKDYAALDARFGGGGYPGGENV
ncbi:MAG: AMP-binding protein [Gammaproteobacteria bacterium]